MLRYDRQTKPGLVALYDIRPGNGAGPFLQPRSPHGAQHITGHDNQPFVLVLITKPTKSILEHKIMNTKLPTHKTHP